MRRHCGARAHRTETSSPGFRASRRNTVVTYGHMRNVGAGEVRPTAPAAGRAPMPACRTACEVRPRTANPLPESRFRASTDRINRENARVATSSRKFRHETRQSLKRTARSRWPECIHRRRRGFTLQRRGCKSRSESRRSNGPGIAWAVFVCAWHRYQQTAQHHDTGQVTFHLLTIRKFHVPGLRRRGKPC